MPECQKINKNGGLDQYGSEHFDGLSSATIRKSVGLNERVNLVGVNSVPVR